MSEADPNAEPPEENPAEDAPVEEAPAEDAPVEEAPAEDAPVEEAPAEDPPAEDPPVEDAPIEDAPAESIKAESVKSIKSMKSSQARSAPVRKTPTDTGVGAQIRRDPHELSFLVPLPETLSFQMIPKIADAKSLWRQGMRKIEETFAEHIQNMHLDFEEKAQKYEYIQNQLETNLKFLEKFYVDMQNKLNEKHALIMIERNEWEAEQDAIKSLINQNSDIVTLNVGGNVHLQTERDVLRSVPGSNLAKMFSGMHKLKEKNGEIFIDRDGKTFETLVNYLRNDRKVFPEFDAKNLENHFFKELHYWGIDTHNKGWQEQYLSKLDKNATFDINKVNRSTYQNQVNQSRQSQRHTVQDTFNPTKIQKQLDGRTTQNTYKASLNYRVEENYDHEMDITGEPNYDQDYSYDKSFDKPSNFGQIGLTDDEEQPGAALKAVKDRWQELGPLKLEEIIANSNEPIDQTLQFGQSRYNKFIIGQIGNDGRVQGVGKEINHIIYEGQFKNDIYHGYGRYIYSNGNFYIGNWVDGKRQGWGKLVDRSGKIYEGKWSHSKFIGNR